MIFKLFQKAFAADRTSSAEYKKVLTALDLNMSRINFGTSGRTFQQKVAVFVVSNLGPMAEHIQIIEQTETGTRRTPLANLDLMASFYIMICLGTNLVYVESAPIGHKASADEAEERIGCIDLAFNMLFGMRDADMPESTHIQAYGTEIYAGVRQDLPNLVKTMYGSWGSLFWDNDLSAQDTVLKGLRDIASYSSQVK